MYFNFTLSVFKKTLIVISFALIIAWNLQPYFIPKQAWNLLTIFIGMIAIIVSTSASLGVVTIISLVVATATGTLSISESLSGFHSHVSWLVLFALFIANNISKSGLGARMAYYLICKSRNNLISLSYTLVICELMLSPAIPSIVARGGGIMHPILTSIIETFNKQGGNKNVTFYLTQVCFHSTIITSAITLTAMAANPLIANMANAFNIKISWYTWFLSAAIPGLLNLTIMPIILFYIIEPDNINVSSIKNLANEQLSSLKPIASKELYIIIVLMALIALWIFGSNFGITTAQTIFMGFAILLATSTINLHNTICDKQAWEIFIWFSILLMFSNYLIKLGTITWINQNIKYLIYNVDAIIVLPCALVAFFYLHYLFVSTTAYISTLFIPFLIILLNCSIPEKISVMTLAILAILSGGLTHYTISTAPGYFATSNVTVTLWCKVGFVISTINGIIWLISCMIWWKIIGWY